ncbi:LytTR family DNA-binding domain-containing protein [Danxiaibacter flavus]|jgi:DNA-binding LytR/AlgR family response regulator|uniref:LytTR family DNA-binding domain-containing protein n=1 Tax=Danxiaibacter flavus TaxID=3049108 RepID=A0ABV3ZKT1_9BACT|nr:LytTR family DNA-binding domain-containing protein [Chitinophagaceae bacterium DXS]
MKCVVIDDEPLALQLVQNYIGKTEGLELVAKFTDTVEAGDFLEKNPVDLLFLDVQMPDENGLQFFSRLENKPMVIFTTAYSQFAVEGFNLDAIDYLLKPFDYARFEKAVNKAKDFSLYRQNKENSEGFLFVKYNYQWTKIYYKDIELIEALDDYIKIYVEPKPILVHMSMKAVSEKLPESKFIRAHRSYIVPVDKIKSWNKNTINIGNKVIPISYTYQKQVTELLQKKLD